MPITKSAKKSLRVSRVKAKQNHERVVALSKALKQVNEKNVMTAISLIDKAAKTGIIHKNKAARIKSQLSKKYSSVKKVKNISQKVESNLKGEAKIAKAKPVTKKTKTVNKKIKSK